MITHFQIVHIVNILRCYTTESNLTKKTFFFFFYHIKIYVKIYVKISFEPNTSKKKEFLIITCFF